MEIVLLIVPHSTSGGDDYRVFFIYLGIALILGVGTWLYDKYKK